MKLSTRLSFINTVLKAKIFKKRTPFFVSWAITNRCNKKCKYCNIWNVNSEELNTKQVLSIIDELSQLGTQMVHFTGGEPLLREDIGVILDYCHKKHILTSINSNGSLVPQRIDELISLNLLGLSLDGPAEVHDYIRGEGAYREVIEAINIAKHKGKEVRMLIVLSQSNLNAIDFLLEKAREFDAPVLFQPATHLLLGGDNKNPITPEDREYKRAIIELIAKKRKTKYIGNSVSGLKFLYYWPNLKRIRCMASFISCRIESDGRLYTCFRNQLQGSQIDGRNLSVRAAFSCLPSLYCDCCCCASFVEINCLLALKIDTLFNSWSFVGRISG